MDFIDITQLNETTDSSNLHTLGLDLQNEQAYIVPMGSASNGLPNDLVFSRIIGFGAQEGVYEILYIGLPYMEEELTSSNGSLQDQLQYFFQSIGDNGSPQHIYSALEDLSNRDIEEVETKELVAKYIDANDNEIYGETYVGVVGDDTINYDGSTVDCIDGYIKFTFNTWYLYIPFKVFPFNETVIFYVDDAEDIICYSSDNTEIDIPVNVLYIDCYASYYTDVFETEHNVIMSNYEPSGGGGEE